MITRLQKITVSPPEEVRVNDVTHGWLTFVAELSFPEDATVTNLEFPDEDWWFGHYGGHSGLFPANYVKLDE